MKKDLDKILDVIITLFDMALSVFKGVKKVEKTLQKEEIIY